MALFKRGKVWWMRFNYQGRQVRRSTETTDKKLAQKIDAKVLTDIVEGKWFERPLGEDKTLSELFDRYTTEYSTHNKAKHAVGQERTWARRMLEFFGDVPLIEVTPSRVAEYKAYLREQGLSPSSINSQRGFLSHAFKKAVNEWEWASTNPVEKVSREKVNNARDRWLTKDEEKKLIDACVIHVTGRGNVLEPRYWLQEIVIFALNTGMRQDEILSLEWPNVDLGRRTLTVVRSKNGEKRTIPLNRRVLGLLEEKAKVRHIRSSLVFASEAGTKIRNLHRGYYNALRRAKIEDFRFHDIRHTFATRLVQAGIDLYKVATLLGHKDIKMTQRYAHHYPESLRDGVEVLDGDVDESGGGGWESSTILAQSEKKGLRENS